MLFCTGRSVSPGHAPCTRSLACTCGAGSGEASKARGLHLKGLGCQNTGGTWQHTTSRALPHLPLTLKARPPSGVRAAATVCASPPLLRRLTATSHTWAESAHEGRLHQSCAEQGRRHAVLGCTCSCHAQQLLRTSLLSLLARSASEAAANVRGGAAKAKHRASSSDDLPQPLGPAGEQEPGEHGRWDMHRHYKRHMSRRLLTS